MDAWSASNYTGPRRWLIVMLVLLMLVMVQFFSLVPLLPLSEGNMSFATFFLIAVIVLIKGGRHLHKPEYRNMRLMVWFIFSVILSYIPAYLYFGQSPVQSFFTYRKFLCYLTLPLILAIRPTTEELRHSLYTFTIIWLIVSILVTYYLQSWVYVDEERLFVDEGDLLHFLPGGRMVCLSFIFALDHYRETRRSGDLFVALAMFLCVFIMFSRTILAAALLVTVLAATSGRRTVRSRIAGMFLMLVFFAVFIYFAWDRMSSLVAETTSQVSDVDYNRNKAVIYMFASQRSWLTILLGNGFISGHVSSIVHDLQSQGIYNSDVGLIGMWHQFGILSVFIILLSVFKSLSRDYSFLVRASGLFLLVSSLTIAYFALLECIFWLCLHWYLLAREEDSVLQIRSLRRTERAMRRERYRSIGR